MKNSSFERCIILLSGGLDSALTLSLCAEKFREIHCLTFDYGQKARREFICARKLAKFYKASHRIIKLPWLKVWSSKSSLVGKRDVPHVNEKTNFYESARAVWIPMRNMVFVSIASSFADSMGGGVVCAGFNREEGETFPDNSESFFKSLNRATRISSDNRVRLSAPLIKFKKDKIVKMAVERKIPFQYLWFCYLNGKEPCWKCESCFRFKRAFYLAGEGKTFEKYFSKS